MEQVNSKPWLGGKQDRRTLAEIAKLWFDLYRKSLAAGVRTYNKLCHIIKGLGDPLAIGFTAKDFAHYRDKRMNGEIYFSVNWRQGANPVTVNLEHSYLSGMFSERIRIGKWKQPNPFENLRKFSIAEKEMSWLMHHQIRELLAACGRGKPHLCLVVRICLSTDARWNEAKNLNCSKATPKT